MYKVAIVVGSARKASVNQQLARAITLLGNDRLQFSMLQIDDLPMYNQDHENDPPAAVLRMKQEIQAADALLFITPEYNRSIPALLKNAIDWGSRPYGQNVWGPKPGAIAGVTPGTTGAVAAQQHLRTILSPVQVTLLSQPELYINFREGMFDATGRVADEAFRSLLNGFLDRFVVLIERFVPPN
jgi:chromate reductase